MTRKIVGEHRGIGLLDGDNLLIAREAIDEILDELADSTDALIAYSADVGEPASARLLATAILEARWEQAGARQAKPFDLATIRAYRAMARGGFDHALPPGRRARRAGDRWRPGGYSNPEYSGEASR